MKKTIQCSKSKHFEDDAASHSAARCPGGQGVRHTPRPQVILTLVYYNCPASNVHLPQERRLGVSKGHHDLATKENTIRNSQLTQAQNSSCISE